MFYGDVAGKFVSFHSISNPKMGLENMSQLIAQSAGESSSSVAVSAPSDHALILAEIRKLETGQSGRLNGLLILAFSVALFLAQQRMAGTAAASWKFIAIMAGVLFFHECGHYVAMRAFGYRNLRMFFIPGFGAAVTGKHYNVAGWKKVVVSLMGPLPGILVGVILGWVGQHFQNALCSEVARVCLFINGFNLLPILPLDGGWSVHGLLFSRRPILDVIFRLVAAGLCIWANSRTSGYAFLILGLFMLLSAPAAYRNARIAAELRKKGAVSAGSDDDQSIPSATAFAIIDLLPSAAPWSISPKQAQAKTTAQRTLAIFETINSRPPGLAASFGLGALHLGGFVAAVFFGVLFLIGPHGNLTQLLERWRSVTSRHSVSSATIIVGPNAWVASARSNKNVLIATFKTQSAATDAFYRLSSERKDGLTTMCFGNSVLTAIWSSDDEARTQWLSRFGAESAEAFVVTPNAPAGAVFSCRFDDSSKAQSVERETNEYLFVPGGLWAIAPWSEADLRSGDQKAMDAKARGTLRRLRLLYATSPEQAKKIDEMKNGIQAAVKNGDESLAGSLRGELRALGSAIRRGNLERLHQDASADAELLAYYESTVTAATRPADTRLEHILSASGLQPFASRFGQIALFQGRPKPGADAWSASGSVGRNGERITLTFSCNDVLTFAPALVRWLESRGGSAIHYEFMDPNHDSRRPDPQMHPTKN